MANLDGSVGKGYRFFHEKRSYCEKIDRLIAQKKSKNLHRNTINIPIDLWYRLDREVDQYKQHRLTRAEIIISAISAIRLRLGPVGVCESKLSPEIRSFRQTFTDRMGLNRRKWRETLGYHSLSIMLPPRVKCFLEKMRFRYGVEMKMVVATALEVIFDPLDEPVLQRVNQRPLRFD